MPPFSDLWWLLIFWGIFLIINIRIIIDRKKFVEYSEWIFITAIFYFLSFWMRRYAWSMYLLSTGVIIFYFKQIKPAWSNIWGKAIPVAILSALYLFAVFYHIPGQRLTGMNWDRFCREFIKCSRESAEFLIANKIEGKFLSNYNWGGWLIWNFPEIKPLIDGRMHLWRDGSGYSAFGEYYFLEQNVNDIQKSGFEVVYMSTEKPLHKRMIELVNEGKWKVVYGDELAGVFMRVTDTTRDGNGTTRE